jgi:FkbM family methyltransferase
VNYRADLPFEVRLWRWWCQNGPKNAEGGTIGGSFLLRRLCDLYSFLPSKARRAAPIRIEGVRTLFVDVLDLHTWKFLLPALADDDPELLLARTLTPSGGVFVDVGANAGSLSLFALTGSVAAVHSFEPNPAMWRLLRLARSENPLAARWHLHESAVGSSNSQLDLHFDAHFSGTGSLHEGWQGPKGQVIQVPVVTLDAWNAQEPVRRVDVLKMDVEGWEAEVIDGAQKVIGSNKPYVWFEHNLSALLRAGLDTEGVLDRLRALGYAAYWDIGRLPGHAPMSRREVSCFRGGRMNLLAVPEGRGEDFHARVLPGLRALRAS